MCQMQSAMGGQEDKGSQCSAPVPRPMMPTVDCSAPQYNAADIVKLVRLCRDPALKSYFWCCDKCVTLGMRVTPTRREATGIKHLRCCLCCWRRLPTSPVFVQEYRRSTSSVWSITLSGPGCRVASSPSDEERSVSLDLSTSAAVNCASICDGCCRVFDGRPRSLSTRTKANDMGCDTDRVPLG